jgi:hypothetical protein
VDALEGAAQLVGRDRRESAEAAAGHAEHGRVLGSGGAKGRQNGAVTTEGHDEIAGPELPWVGHLPVGAAEGRNLDDVEPMLAGPALEGGERIVDPPRGMDDESEARGRLEVRHGDGTLFA